MARSVSRHKTASKEIVLATLERSVNYCNSHHRPVQEMFESTVDSLVTPDSCGKEFETRRKDMKALFPVLLDKDLQGFIPSLSIDQDQVDLAADAFLSIWFTKWAMKFIGAWKTSPSSRVAKAKQATTDEALVQMVIPHAGSEENARMWAMHHNLFMSAENVGGNLLEQYIASKIRPFGWIWCRGEILTAVDFCNDACSCFLQVKNKSNTENSSSKGFRESHKAPMWYRMEAKRRDGTIVTHWSELTTLIKEGATSSKPVPCDLFSEEDYLAFVYRASVDNPYLITPIEYGVNVCDVALNPLMRPSKEA